MCNLDPADFDMGIRDNVFAVLSTSSLSASQKTSWITKAGNSPCGPRTPGASENVYVLCVHWSKLTEDLFDIVLK